MKTAGIIKIVIGGLLMAAILAIMGGLYTGRSLWTRDDDGVVSLLKTTPTPIPMEAMPDAADRQEAHEENSKDDGATPAAGSAEAAGLNKTADGYEVSASSVQAIDIGWIAGSVEIVGGSGSQIRIAESALSASAANEPMVCTLNNGKLTIQYCDNFQSTWKQIISGNFSVGGKTLVITLPADIDIDDLEIQTVSADIAVSAVAAREIDIESVSGTQVLESIAAAKLSAVTVSGEVRMEACAADELDVEAVSGSITVRGAFAAVEADSTSGELSLYCSSVPGSIEADTISGEIRVYLPSDAGFTAALDTVSGNITSEFACVSTGKALTCGDGACQCRFESVSGDVRILINR